MLHARMGEVCNESSCDSSEASSEWNPSVTYAGDVVRRWIDLRTGRAVLCTKLRRTRQLVLGCSWPRRIACLPGSGARSSSSLSNPALRARGALRKFEARAGPGGCLRERVSPKGVHCWQCGCVPACVRWAADGWKRLAAPGVRGSGHRRYGLCALRIRVKGALTLR